MGRVAQRKSEARCNCKNRDNRLIANGTLIRDRIAEMRTQIRVSANALATNKDLRCGSYLMLLLKRIRFLPRREMMILDFRILLIRGGVLPLIRRGICACRSPYDKVSRFFQGLFASCEGLYIPYQGTESSMVMTISELARSGGVGVETVRYYQRRGLLPDPKPSRAPQYAGRKHYGNEERQRLSFIRSAKDAGFSLDEIGTLLKLDKIDDRLEVRTLAQKRITALDHQISSLTKARDALTQLARKCADGGTGACPILEAFER